MEPWLVRALLAIELPVPVVLVAGFLTALTAHPAGTAGFAGLVAYVVAETWQRWRQRREFQHRAMLEFSEASVAVMACLWDLTQARAHGGTGTDRYRELMALYPVKLEPLVARDAQFYAVFEEPLVGELSDFTQLMRWVHERICDPNLAVAPDPVRVVRPMIDCLTARRRLIIAHMALAMRLRQRREVRALEQELGDEAASTPPGFQS